jgi:hypothetical protein
MNLIEDKNFLKIEHIKFIENTILKSNFPFYYQNYSIPNDKNEILTHVVIKGPEYRKQNETFSDSNYLNIFIDILNTFCKKNNILVNEIYRIGVNLTFNNGVKKCQTHIDHDFPHKQLLIYLNDIKDKNSYTVLINKKKIKKIKPVKYKGICFDNVPHYHYYPKKGARIVAVFTFK